MGPRAACRCACVANSPSRVPRATESGRRSRLAKAMRLRSRALNDGGLYLDGQEEASVLEASRARHTEFAPAPENCTMYPAPEV